MQPDADSIVYGGYVNTRTRAIHYMNEFEKRLKPIEDQKDGIQNERQNY